MSEYRETLVSPQGRTVTVTSPGEYNDLRYGLGYRPPAEVAQKQPAEQERQDEPERDNTSVEDDAPADL